jgi:hypothetical protein
MTATNPRAGWEKVGDQFYRKIQLYESVFDPDLELENYLVAGAPYGGAIGKWQCHNDGDKLIQFCSTLPRREQDHQVSRQLGRQVKHRRVLVRRQAHQSH